MFCINCGKEVNENTAFCPFCGAKMDNAGQPVAPQQVEELTPAAEPTPVAEQPAPVAEQPAPTPVVEQPAPVAEQPAPTAPTTPTIEPNPSVQPAVAPTTQPTTGVPGAPTQGNGKNKTLILIIILAVVVVIGVVVIGKTFIGSKDKTEPTTPTTTDNGGNEPTTVADNTNTASYMGYTFTLPDGFTDKTDAKFGLVITNGTVGYSIKIDFSNSYDTYLDAFMKKYPTQAANIEKTVSGRKYIIAQLTEDQYKASQYITEANSGETFIGMTMNKTNTIEYSDYQTLTTILDSSKKSGSSFAAGDANDPGTNGPVSFDVDRSAFGFEN